MNRKPAVVASVAIVVSMLLMSAWAWTQLPAGARIPVHWGPNGTPDRYADQLQALFQLPIVACLIAVLFAILPRFATGRMGSLGMLGLSEGALSAIWSGVWMTCMLAVGGNHGVTVLTAAGAGPTHVVQTEIGMLLVILGSYHLGSVSRTSLLGVRTPWTLASELAWDRSQQLAGQLIVVMGLSVVVLALHGNGTLLMGTFVSSIGAFVVAVSMYSYYLWKMDPQRETAQ